MPASPGATVSTQTSSISGFVCNRRPVLPCNQLSFRWRYSRPRHDQRSLQPPFTSKFHTRVAPLKLTGRSKVLLPARVFFETGCDDPHRRHLARYRAHGNACRYRTALTRIVAVFGAAQPHCAYLFANRRATRIKVLVRDGLGIWLAPRRLHQGKFFWPGSRHGTQVELGEKQLQALVLGLPWQRVGPGGAISIL